MAARMEKRKAPQHDQRGVRDSWLDKAAERLTGLFVINGRAYDTYRQSWVATTAPAYVAAGREPLVDPLDSLQKLVDQCTPDQRQRLEAIGALAGGRVAPGRVSERDAGAAPLFSPDEPIRPPLPPPRP